MKAFRYLRNTTDIYDANLLNSENDKFLIF